jgi:hypothetical protein
LYSCRSSPCTHLHTTVCFLAGLMAGWFSKLIWEGSEGGWGAGVVSGEVIGRLVYSRS